jgi:hypothetical protein
MFSSLNIPAPIAAKEEATDEKQASPKRQESPTKRNLLGDLTIYRINKEFEGF